MSMVVAHNIGSINAQRNLNINNSSLNSSISKLSSGYRINTGADAPADLVISEQLRSQIFGLERATRNTTEAINVLSIAEGAMNEMNNILKKMKALAIHAANNGITSPDQIASDQAEMDSGIQTLERIANSTKYSDQFLLNGAKDISYSLTSSIKGTQNNALVNTGLTNFTQIFKRNGYQVSIGFTGAISANNATAIGNAAMSKQASKAYLEIDSFEGTKSQVDKNGYITKGQSFILTGTMGARQFNFSEGAHVGEIVSAIHNVASSTGVDAALIFNRNQTINVQADKVGMSAIGVSDAAANSAIAIYDNYTIQDGGSKALIASSVELSDTACTVFGKNTDGQGFVYVKVVGSGENAAYELYKDSTLSTASLIGSGVGDKSESTERNNSGMTMKIQIDNAKYGDVFKISLGGLSMDACTVRAKNEANPVFDLGNSSISGVQLGVNTDSAGKIYLKTTWDQTGDFAVVSAYNNALMREQDKVAQTSAKVDMTGADTSIVLDSIWNDEKTANTGMGITLKLGDATATSGATRAGTTETMDITFLNLGARIYSSEYGSNAFVKVQQFEGGIFTDYEDAGNYDSAKLIENNTTYQKNGQDATITVNGQQMKSTGLNLSLATPDVMANVTFNAGKTGSTTLAQVGYGEGSVFSKATSLTLAYALDDKGEARLDTGSNADNNVGFTALLNNACHNSVDTIGSFTGGMQLQLGEGSGDQERTIIGLKSMLTAQLGRIEVTAQFDPSKAVTETRTLSIQDVMGGQVASLSSNPTIAMKIIEQAITDVSNNRALIGAVQSNMLQTNANNLAVTIENITKTESNIRDTDMASEMTEFTKNQVMSQAAQSMLAQANQQAQGVLSLLQ